MRLHLLDGTYELFRFHFGGPPRFAPDGRAVGAVYGLITSTLALLQDTDVTHLAAAFDTQIRSFRNDLFDGYKTEEGMPEELLAQFPLAEQAMEALGVTVWSMIEYEADDALATAAVRYADDFEQIVLLTPDKDLAQCIRGDRIVSFNRRQRVFMNEEGVRDKFGVGPASIPDYLSLVGDSADGFPGVPGWGAKSAASVLARYPHLEEIPLESDRWEVTVRGAGRLGLALRAHFAEALLYRFLAQLRRDVPLSPGVAPWPGVHREPYEALCVELGFEQLLDRPHRWAAL